MPLEDLLTEDDFKRMFHIFSDISPSPMMLCREGKVLHLNKAAEEISGYSEDDIKGMDSDNLLDPEYKVFARKYFGIRPIDLPILDKKGKDLFLKVWGKKLDPYCIVLAEPLDKKEYAPESSYNELVNLLPETIFEVNLHRRVSFVNSKGYELFASDDFSGEKEISVYELFPPEEHKRLDKNIDRIIRRRISSRIEYKAKQPDGTLFPVEIQGTPIIRNGQTIGVRGILTDITERKAYEEALETSEKLLASIIEAIAIPTFVINKEHVVTHWNAACERMTGVPKEHVLGTSNHSVPFYSLKRSTLADLVVDNLGMDQISEIYPTINVLDNSYQEQGFFSYLDKWLFFTATPLFEGEEITGSVETIQDITEQKAATLRTQKMLEGIVRSQGRTAEIFDTDTGDHTKRIGLYCGKLAELMDFDKEYQESISLQAQLHDIGKVHIPYEILNKEGILTPEEFDAIKDHTIYGAIILRGCPELALAKQIAHFHHERYDGSGYPDGLVGEEIPVAARIATIADVFDALVTKRVYKEAYSYEKAFRIMTEGDERIDPKRHFDPKILRIFRENYGEFTRIHASSVMEEYTSTLDILVVEDDERIQDLLSERASSYDHVKFHQVRSVEEAKKAISKDIKPHLSFIDINLPDGTGHDIARELRSKWPDSYLICTTGESFVSENVLYDQILHKPYSLSKVDKLIDLFSRYR